MNTKYEDWDLSEGELFRREVQDGRYKAVDIRAAAEAAHGVLNLEAPEMNGYVVPLHSQNGEELTNEYVVWREESETIGWFDPQYRGFGGPRSKPASELSQTIIGHRMRFWVRADQSDHDFDLPTSRVSPGDTLTEDERSAFFDELVNFIERQRTATRTSNWETYSEVGLETAIKRGQAIGPFLFVAGGGQSKESRYIFQYEEEQDEDDVDLYDKGLYPKNNCILDVANSDTFPVPATILEIEDESITLQLDWDKIEETTAVRKQLQSPQTEVWISELLNPIPFERQTSAVTQVRESPSKSQLITGSRPATFQPRAFAIPDSDVDLNTYQQKALIWADAASDLLCIHGPPGTGKTRTLTSYVQHAVRNREKVLITAHSNQAVDNLIAGDSTLEAPEPDSLHEMAQDPDSRISIARVGSNTENRVVEENYLNTPHSEATVVAATTSGASKFDPNTFDVAVLDEATQASRPSAAIVLNCAEKLILAGDHKQLSPYCAGEDMQEEDTHISLFEYLMDRYGDGVSVFLRKQYRMNEEIAAFPNQRFYDGLLETADRNKEWTVDGLKPLIGVNIDGVEQRESQGNSVYNRDEAEAAAKQVKLLSNSGIHPTDIGVITMYSGQKRKIYTALSQVDSSLARGVTIDTVDSFQGGEREAIIVSFVRSNDRGNSGFLEFPEEGKRRLNVALTRARKRLVLIGNWGTLGTVATHRSVEDSCADCYQALAEHLRKRDRMLELDHP